MMQVFFSFNGRTNVKKVFSVVHLIAIICDILSDLVHLYKREKHPSLPKLY